jgi:hypothetical protein
MANPDYVDFPKPTLHVHTTYDSALYPKLASSSPSVLSTSQSPRRRTADLAVYPSSPDLTSTNLPDAEPAGPEAGKRLMRTQSLPRQAVSGTANIPGLEGVEISVDRLESLRRWILGIAIGALVAVATRKAPNEPTVTFDLELGPILACVFPQLRLYPFEAENMSVDALKLVSWVYVLIDFFSAFSAFPDSPQFREGSSIHSFRIRERTIPSLSRPATSADRPELRDGFMYGYSYFNQKRDTSSKRGYSQVHILHPTTTSEINVRLVVCRRSLATSIRRSVFSYRLKSGASLPIPRTSYSRSGISQHR